MEKIYSTQEAADILHISKYSVHRYINAGLLKATRIGNKTLLVKESDLEDFLDRAGRHNYSKKLAEEIIRERKEKAKGKE